LIINNHGETKTDDETKMKPSRQRGRLALFITFLLFSIIFAIVLNVSLLRQYWTSIVRSTNSAAPNHHPRLTLSSTSSCRVTKWRRKVDMGFRNHPWLSFINTKTNVPWREEEEMEKDYNGTTTEFLPCRVYANANARHFPHAMQQIYQCWSLFELRADADAAAAALSLMNRQQQHDPPPRVLLLPLPKMTSTYTNGILHALQSHGNVSVEYYDPRDGKASATTTTREALELHSRDPVFYIRNVAHMDRLRQVVLADTMMSSFRGGRPPNDTAMIPAAVVATAATNESVSDDDNDDHHPPQIRITVLDRTKNRQFVNLLDIVDALRAAFPPDQGVTVRTVTFDDTSFIEQVQVWATTDLLIAAHGAALTGQFLLHRRRRQGGDDARDASSRCRHNHTSTTTTTATTSAAATAAVAQGYLIEVFPPHYYYDRFFGSLADASNVNVWHVYEDTDHPERFDRARRRQYRHRPLCPDPAAIVAATADAFNNMMKNSRELQPQQQNCSTVALRVDRPP
jgi:hypothetical protein